MADTRLAALLSNPPLLMDGAMGTELDRRGTSIASTDWVASTLGAPDDVAAIHKSYAEAGAELHIANTFATARHVLAEVGLADRFEDLNRDAVAQCRTSIEAVGAGPCWIAGSISTYMIGSDRGRLPAHGELLRNASDQAAILADEDCHMIVLEMLHDVETSACLMEAAAITGLPVSVGLTVVFDEDRRPVMRGLKTGTSTGQLSLEAALPPLLTQMEGDYPWILTLMHSDLDETDAALDVVRSHWDGPIGVYPNSGKFTDGYGWDHRAICTPQEFSAHASAWADAGAAFIGGCCGIGPDHIRAFAEAQKAQV
ncbi:MAG: homocysteine S-methyltransferase family protein [Pseudomonadota bacterium]